MCDCGGSPIRWVKQPDGTVTQFDNHKEAKAFKDSFERSERKHIRITSREPDTKPVEPKQPRRWWVKQPDGTVTKFEMHKEAKEYKMSLEWQERKRTQITARQPKGWVEDEQTVQ